MSETITFHRRAVKWQLLATVSASALLAAATIFDAAIASEDDSSRPVFWIELGGELQHVEGQGELFAPHFLTVYADSAQLRKPTPVQAQNPPPFEFAEDGRISFQPENSDWVVSAAARYGRSSNAKNVHHQTYNTFFVSQKYGHVPPNENVRGIDKFADTQVQRANSYEILDFTVGKDVGLGVFGRDGTSTLNLGVRFAQFESRENFAVRARPDLLFKDLSLPTFHVTFEFPYFHTYHAVGEAERGFHGVGPSLSWNGSTRLVGDMRKGEFSFDWDANAALLFGRQRVRTRHQETGHYVTAPGFVLRGVYYTAYKNPPAGHSGERNVTVPNIGLTAGASYRIEDFTVSLGYRADFFFNAMDVGIDKRKSGTLGLYGPFASVSVGLGG